MVGVLLKILVCVAIGRVDKITAQENETMSCICYNGATCSSTTNETCLCTEGWTGTNCDIGKHTDSCEYMEW